MAAAPRRVREGAARGAGACAAGAARLALAAGGGPRAVSGRRRRAPARAAGARRQQRRRAPRAAPRAARAAAGRMAQGLLHRGPEAPRARWGGSCRPWAGANGPPTCGGCAAHARPGVSPGLGNLSPWALFPLRTRRAAACRTPHPRAASSAKMPPADERDGCWDGGDGGRRGCFGGRPGLRNAGRRGARGGRDDNPGARRAAAGVLRAPPAAVRCRPRPASGEAQPLGRAHRAGPWAACGRQEGALIAGGRRACGLRRGWGCRARSAAPRPAAGPAG
jgi:hypothetical protein